VVEPLVVSIDEKLVDVKEGEAEAVVDGDVVAVLLDLEVVATVGLPTASVVVSDDMLSTPLMSVVIIVSPSVTVVSGTPASGVGLGEGEGELL